ncbi:MAG: hypothetical protein WC980_04735 [Candidatus Brocadiia bacterium]
MNLFLRISIILTILIIIGAGCSATHTTQSNQARIEQVMREFQNCINTMDFAKIYEMMSNKGRAGRSKEEISSMATREPPSGLKVNIVKIHRITVITPGALAEAIITIDALFTDDPENPKERYDLKVIIPFENGDWRIGDIFSVSIEDITIDELIKTINSYRNAMEDGSNLQSAPVEDAIRELGELKASKAIKTLIDFMCFLIDDETSTGVSGLDYQLMIDGFQSAVYLALTKIGQPAVSPLVTVLRYGTFREHFNPHLTESGKQELIEAEKKFSMKDWSSNGEKARFARKALYLIEGNRAINTLEQAYKFETDQYKKGNLAEQLAKLEKEIKSGELKTK